MHALFNRQAFTQTDFYSGDLRSLSVIAHPLPEEGRYLGLVFQGETQIASFQLQVEGRCESMQANVDVAAVAARTQAPQAPCQDVSPWRVAPGGYLVLHNSRGEKRGFYVALTRVTREGSETVMDSRALGPGDFYAITLLRPGLYEVMGRNVEGAATIRVAYPKPGRRPLQLPEPLRVQVSRRGFEPNRAELLPAQGLVFAITDARDVSFTVRLVEPDDGPHERRRQRRSIQWRNPRAKS